MYGIFTYTCLIFIYAKYKQIYHTWILWVHGTISGSNPFITVILWGTQTWQTKRAVAEWPSGA